MTDYYRKSSEEVMKTLGVTDQGLSHEMRFNKNVKNMALMN